MDASKKCEIVIIDQDNARASAGWPVARAFRDRVNRAYALDPRHSRTVVIIAVDERRNGGKRGAADGERQHVRCHSISPRIVAAFSGQRYRADDLIARDAEWWSSRAEVASVLAVSSDKLVRRRCNEIKSRSNGCGRVRFETGEHFAVLLPAEGAAPIAPTAPTASIAAEASTSAATTDAPADAMATAATASAIAGSIDAIVKEYIGWVQTEQPGPAKTASDVAHAGEKARQVGKKRKLGVYR